jgi:hypothetical protein
MPVRRIIIGRSVALVFQQRLTRDGNGLIQVRVEAGSRSGGGRDKGLDERQVLVCRDAVIEVVRQLVRGSFHDPIGRGGVNNLDDKMVAERCRCRVRRFRFGPRDNVVPQEGYSVEFFDMTGNTVAVVTLPAGALRLPTPADRPAVRALSA